MCAEPARSPAAGPAPHSPTLARPQGNAGPGGWTTDLAHQTPGPLNHTLGRGSTAAQAALVSAPTPLSPCTESTVESRTVHWKCVETLAAGPSKPLPSPLGAPTQRSTTDGPPARAWPTRSTLQVDSVSRANSPERTRCISQRKEGAVARRAEPLEGGEDTAPACDPALTPSPVSACPWSASHTTEGTQGRGEGQGSVAPGRPGPPGPSTSPYFCTLKSG